MALVVALCCAGIGVASAAGPSIELGADEPTTTVTVDGTAIELIPATSYELPPEAAVASSVEGQSPASATETAGNVGAGIEVQGVSSSTGPTASAGVGGAIGAVWYVVAAALGLGVAALWLARARRSARH